MAIEVQTTQNVTIDYEPAGLGYRLLAYSLDWIVIIAWLLGWTGILDVASSMDLFDLLDSSYSFGMILAFIIFVPAIFYDLLFETLNNGQSIGKMVFRIKVVNINGTAPSFGAYLLRWLFRLVDFFITQWILGTIMVAVTKNSQRLGDMIAGTTVIDLKMKNKSSNLQVPELEFHEDYKVSYYDVLDRLSDKDIQTVLSIMQDTSMSNNEFFISRLADKIKQVTGYSYDGSDKVFLSKVVSDYNYLALQ